jgi:hypothetical protein
MRYAALIYVPEGGPAEPGLLGEYMAFSQSASEAGVMTGGERLAESTSATSVRVRNGKRSTSDGPFAETKEILGGFMILDCPSLDEAIEWAAKIPGARDGTIEVRPIIERDA